MKQLKVLYTEKDIQRRVKELSCDLVKDYKDKNLLMIGILNGCFIFMSDLSRYIGEQLADLEMRFMGVESYGDGTVSSREPIIVMDIRVPIRGRHVVIVEDIIDSGYSLNILCGELISREPASLKICALLSKRDRREVEVAADYIGFEIPDEFVVGYGMDAAQRYRQLPYIGYFPK